MFDTGSRARAAIVVGLLVLVGPVLMMTALFSAAGGMGPMGGPVVVPPVLFLPVLLALGAGYAGYRLLRADAGGDEHAAGRTEDPVERAQRRYADGEIDETELERQLEHHLEAEYPPEANETDRLETASE